MPLLFGSALFLTILRAASTVLADRPGVIGGIANVVSHLDSSPFIQHLPEGCGNLHDRIIQAENEKRLYIHDSSEITAVLPYTEITFKADLAKISAMFFRDSDEVSTVVSEVVKQASNCQSVSGMFELHRIEHENNNVNLSSLSFSPIKTDKIWNLYFFSWGTPYVDIHLSKKEMILLSQVST